jgi:hypothetical protein
VPEYPDLRRGAGKGIIILTTQHVYDGFNPIRAGQSGAWGLLVSLVEEEISPQSHPEKFSVLPKPTPKA